MRRIWNLVSVATLAAVLSVLSGCQIQPNQNATPIAKTSPSTSPSPSPTLSAKVSETAQITLPLLDALLAQPSFVTELKTKLQVTDDQVEALRRIASAEVQRLRDGNAETSEGNADDPRTLALDRISEVVGDEKARQLTNFADEFSARSDDDSSAKAESTGRSGVPTDTRVVVNIPAYRMDLFRDGQLIKSYKIGIGYPEFPLPEGMRKAQSVIFNPTWTPPDSPWVAKMKDVSPGERIEAGSELNPLGPIKIPIGMPSLIHGGKSVAKLGKFASHGCVGLTNAQVKDFAKLLLEAAGNEVTDEAIAGFLANKTETRVVKLSKTVPVELRYETITIEDGKLHIYKDVYNKNTNNEENLRKVLETAGVNFDSLGDDEKSKMLTALNSLSSNPKQTVAQGTKKTKPQNKSTSMKEEIIEIASLSKPGYPAPVDLDKGSGTTSPKKTHHTK
jgi:hypothetical protein